MPMAQVPDRSWWDDERIRHVQRPGDELLAPSAGHGAGRHAAKIFRKNEFESASALGGHPLLRRVLGAVSGTGFQAAGHFGHHALWRQPDAGVRDAGGAAHSRTEIKARIPRAGRPDWRDRLWNLPAASPDPRDRRERERSRPRNERTDLRGTDYGGRLRVLPGHRQASAQRPRGYRRKRRDSVSRSHPFP